MTDFKDKKVAIVGFGAEGAAAAEFMLTRGALVSLFEQKPESALDADMRDLTTALKLRGVEFFFGDDNRQAITASYDLLVRSPGVPLKNELVLAAGEKGIPVTSGTAIFFEECPATVVGVTGTKGKGTTASLIYTMLQNAGRPAYLVGNIGEPALSILGSIPDGAVVIYELSSFQLLEVKKSPHIAIVLMITQDHLDFHGSVLDYAAAKENIVRFQDREDFVVASLDYEISRRIGEASPGRKFWTSRRKPVAEGCCVKDGAIVLMNNGEAQVIVKAEELALPGAHNLENACAAVMAASLLELRKEPIQEALRSFRGLPHRLELVGEYGGVRWYDDSISTTPESAIAAIEAFDAPKILILGGSSKGADFSDLAAAIQGSNSIKAIIGIGKEWERMKEEIGSVKAKIVDGLGTMEEVVKTAAEIAEASDVVLLSPACASFGMFKSYKDRGDQFKKAVNALA